MDDDYKINTCTFELYKKEGAFKQREYSEEINNPTLNSKMELILEEFEDGNNDTSTDND